MRLQGTITNCGGCGPLGESPMANVSVQLPPCDTAPLLPGWDDDRSASVPTWDRGPARARAVCPIRASRTRETRTFSLDEPTEQGIRVLLVDDHLLFQQPLAFMLMW